MKAAVAEPSFSGALRAAGELWVPVRGFQSEVAIFLTWRRTKAMLRYSVNKPISMARSNSPLTHITICVTICEVLVTKMRNVMQTVVMHLPDLVFSKANEEAKEHKMDVGSFCAGVLSDHFLTGFAEELPVPNQSARLALASDAAKSFDVSKAFPNFPRGSIELAQAFVDSALKHPGVWAYKKKRGVGFEPNFVFLEYLLSQKGRVGIVVSFYGQPDRHKNPPSILVKGIPSYSRAHVETQAELKTVLPHVRQAYDLKFPPDPEL